MEYLSEIFKAPLNTLAFIAGFLFVFFTFFEVSKSGVKPRKMDRKNYLIPVVLPTVIGLALIGLGVSMKPNGAATTPEVTPTVTNNPTGTSTMTSTLVPATDTATATKSPTETATFTPLPTLTDTVTPSPIPILTLHDGCIADQTWQFKSANPNSTTPISNARHCLDLDDFGIAAETGGTLRLVASPREASNAAEIFTPISDRSTVEFSVSVKTFYLVYDGTPAYISFGIAPANDPLATKGSSRFKLQIRQANSPLVLFYLADPSQPDGLELGTQHYLWGRVYKIRLVLRGVDMEVYIDNVKLNRTLSLPTGSKVFSIGYNVPLLAKADVNISNIVINGVDQ